VFLLREFFFFFIDYFFNLFFLQEIVNVGLEFFDEKIKHFSLLKDACLDSFQLRRHPFQKFLIDPDGDLKYRIVRLEKTTKSFPKNLLNLLFDLLKIIENIFQIEIVTLFVRFDIMIRKIHDLLIEKLSLLYFLLNILQTIIQNLANDREILLFEVLVVDDDARTILTLFDIDLFSEELLFFGSSVR